MDLIHKYWMNAIAFCIFAYVIFNFIKHGGIKNSMFGGKITKTYGEVSGQKRSGMSQLIKIHKIHCPEQELIGLELTSKSMLSWQMQPFSMSKQEAQNLIRYLEHAVRD